MIAYGTSIVVYFSDSQCQCSWVCLFYGTWALVSSRLISRSRSRCVQVRKQKQQKTRAGRDKKILDEIVTSKSKARRLYLYTSAEEHFSKCGEGLYECNGSISGVVCGALCKRLSYIQAPTGWYLFSHFFFLPFVLFVFTREFFFFPFSFFDVVFFFVFVDWSGPLQKTTTTTTIKHSQTLSHLVVERVLQTRVIKHLNIKSAAVLFSFSGPTTGGVSHRELQFSLSSVKKR